MQAKICDAAQRQYNTTSWLNPTCFRLACKLATCIFNRFFFRLRSKEDSLKIESPFSLNWLLNLGLDAISLKIDTLSRNKNEAKEAQGTFIKLLPNAHQTNFCSSFG